MKRPASVTTVAWLIIVAGADSLVALLTSVGLAFLKSHDVVSMRWLPVTLAVANIACGVLILRGSSWARFFVLGIAFFAIFGLVVANVSVAFILYTVAKYSCVAYVLFRRSASEYFDGPVLNEA